MPRYRYVPPLPLGLLVLERFRTFKAFGEAVGISGQAAAEYFAGNPARWKDPGLSIATRMAEELGMSLDEFSTRLRREREERLREVLSA